MPPGKLTIIVGPPGAGKSTLARTLHRSITGLCIEDFHANANHNSPEVKDSRHYRALIEALRAGHDCIVADIEFCKRQRRQDLERTIRQDVPSVCMEWRHFEKNYKKCENNILHRNSTHWERDLERLKDLYDEYIIPCGVVPIEIWQHDTR